MNHQKGNPGLPSKPYTPGPAPPLPAGPSPAQQQAYGPLNPAAHAAAWAAYYQAQGVTSGAAYTAAPAPAQPTAASAPTVENPYANYGYGAGAQHASTFQPGGPKPGQPGQSPMAGPSQQYRPTNGQGYPTPAIQPQHGAFPQQQQPPQPQPPQQPQFAMQQPYNPTAAGAGYQPQQQRPPFQQPGQPGGQPGFGGGTWSGPQQPQGPGGPTYRPPGPQQPQQPQQQFQKFTPQPSPFYPQQQAYTPPPQQPFRPPSTPQPMQHNSPFRPPPGQMNGAQHQHRPPMSTPPHPTGGFPPAKRPRFDGPGGGMNGGAKGGNNGAGQMGGMNINSAQARPPNNPPLMAGPVPVRPPGAGGFGVGGVGVGIGPGGAPGFNAQTSGPQPQLPNRGANIPSRGGAPPATSSSRPPIHLGSGGPLPALPGFASQTSGGRGVPAGPARGGNMDSLRGGRGGRGGGMMNAPRGPAGMRRQQGQMPAQDSGVSARQRGGAGGVGGVKGGEKEKKKKDKEVKATMTDFRIVGIEMRELGWSWGIIGGKWSESDNPGEGKEEIKDEKRDTDQGEGEAETVAPVDPTSIDLTPTESVNPPESTLPTNDEPAHAEPPKTETETDPSVAEPTSSESQSETPLDPAPKVNAAEASTSASGSAENGGVEEKGEAEPAEVVEEKEKRGEKRKAKSPDDGDEGSSKKRASNYILTHKKPNCPPPASGPGSAYESNANRFRIYFDSPPELDRNPPKAGKRGGGGRGAGSGGGGEGRGANPNKRGRRDTSSVAPSRAGEVESEVVVEEPVVEEPQVVEVTAEEPPTQVEMEVKKVKAEVVEEIAEDIPPAASASALVEPAPQEPIVAQEPLEAEGEAWVTAAPVPEKYAVDGDRADPTPVAEQREEFELAIGAGESHVAETEGEGAQTADRVQEQVQDDTAVEHTLTGESFGLSAEVEVAGDIEATEKVKPVVDAVEAVEAVEVDVEDGEGDAGDASMISATNDQAVEHHTSAPSPPPSDPAPSTTAPTSPKPTSAHSTGITSTSTPAEIAAALTASANNTASAYKSRARRRSSVSSTSSKDYQSTLADGGASTVGYQTGLTPSVNRLSVVYGETKRLCFDAEIVEKVRIWRKEGRIEVMFKAGKEDEEVGEAGLPKGVLMETYDTSESRFISYSADQLSQLHNTPSNPSPTSSDPTTAIPPLHRIAANLIVDGTAEAFSVSLYLNKKSPLSEPKWCKTNQADAWLYEQFESRKGQDAGWRGKLEVVDPDPVPSLRNLLDNWASSSSYGTPPSRRAFISSLSESPNDLLEILLRLARGERNPTLASSSTPSFGPLARSIRPDSPFASHQTHVSLAILAMYRLTTDYAARAGESMEVVEEKVGDIIRSLPVPLITKSLDGLFKEWQGGDGK